MGSLTRGELARLCGVSFEAVRYYEERGLIPRPERSSSNYRLYGEEAVQRIRLIKRAQGLGFSLREIRELLELQARPGARCADVRSRAEAKIADIDAKIRTLRSMRRALAQLVRQCDGEAELTSCPILECLGEEGGMTFDPDGGSRRSAAGGNRSRRPGRRSRKE